MRLLAHSPAARRQRGTSPPCTTISPVRISTPSQTGGGLHRVGNDMKTGPFIVDTKATCDRFSAQRKRLSRGSLTQVTRPLNSPGSVKTRLMATPGALAPYSSGSVKVATPHPIIGCRPSRRATLRGSECATGRDSEGMEVRKPWLCKLRNRQIERSIFYTASLVWRLA